MRNSLRLASAILLASACGDDDASSPAPSDGGQDAALVSDAGSRDIDASASLDAAAPDANVTIDATSDAAQAAALSIIGRWHTNFAYTETITATAWTGATIVEYDNEQRVAYVQNAVTAESPLPGFNKYVWTPIQNGVFYYCTIEYGLPTLAEAKASTKVADASDPLTGGCNNFGWTQMGPVLEIEGSYTSGADQVVITSDKLGANTIARYDNDANSAVIGVTGQGDAGVQFYSRMLWAAPSTNQLYICIVADGFETEQAAAANTATADSTNLTSGCADGPWTALSKQ